MSPGLPLAEGATLVLARHGRTAWNAEGRFQGQADPALDAVGLAQARALATSVLQGIPEPVFVVSSDLRRARQTAEAFSFARSARRRVDRRLREVDLGGWEGLNRAQAAVCYPAEYAAWAAGGCAAWKVRRGGGETAVEAGARAVQPLVELAGVLGAGQTGVVVSHGLVLQAALRMLGVADPPRLGNGEYVRVWAPSGAETLLFCPLCQVAEAAKL